MWEKIERWIKLVLAEAYSWLRWIGHYRAPIWLGYPFNFPLFRALYSILLIAILAFFIPFATLQEFLGQVVFDLWKKYIGETSSVGLQDLIGTIRLEWFLPILVILVIWGLLVWVWARPKQKFFKAIRTAGIIPLRGPGERMLFLERMRKDAVSGIGLGPKAQKIHSTYIPRQEDESLRDCMRNLRSQQGEYGLLITGQPVSGKTRTAMELIFDLNPGILFVWPRGNEPKNLADFNKWNTSAIIFADNLALSAGSGDIPLPASLLRLLQVCPHLLLVGTVRTKNLPADHRGLEAVELSDLSPDEPEIQALAEELAEIETRNRNTTVKKEEISGRFNGHPAGLVAGLDAMREIFESLAAESRSMLQAVRLLWEMGIRQLTLERVWDAAGLVNGCDVSPARRQMILAQLEREGFISLHLDGNQNIEIYESYMDQVVTLPDPVVKLEVKVMEQWREIEDAVAFQERGNYYSDSYSARYQQDPQLFLTIAIQAYTEALRFLTPECAPLDYAGTQNNLGAAYQTLAAHQEPAHNLDLAIQAYTETLRFYTLRHAPLYYAMTQNNLGLAYQTLAAHQEPAYNLAIAIHAYTEALRYRNPERVPLDYATTQNNLGEAYRNLAAHQKPAYNLDLAIHAYTEALRFRTPEYAPLNYASTKNNLGNAYANLAAYQEPVHNLDLAIQAYMESLRFYTPERVPLDYATIKNNLGETYRNLAAHQEPAHNLDLAIQAYTEALRYRTPERVPLDYAMTQNNLGAVYQTLAAHQEPVHNLDLVIQAYTEALRFRTPEHAPLYYAMTQNNLGLAYQSLVAYQEPVHNLDLAIQAYTEALRFRTPEHAPLDYAMTQNNLGAAYQTLAAHQEPVHNLDLAIQAYTEALRFYTPERAPLDYSMTQSNLGFAYGDLAAHQETKEEACSDLQMALKAYEEALRYITPQNHSQYHRVIVANQQEAKDKMQSIGCD